MVQFRFDMLLSILLSVALAAGQQAQPPQPPANRAEAEQLARSGSHRAALERFQAIAAANPDDIEARVWIARLHALMGNHREAVDVYESIIAASPQHLETLIGLGHALVTLGRFHDAADVLNRAESLAAESAAVLAAQGRLHAAAGRSTLALAYYERALTIDPAAEAARRELLELRARRAHRVEVGYIHEHFTSTVADLGDMDDPQAFMGTVNARLSDQWRLAGTVQHQRKFSTDQTRGGIGIEWMPRYDVRVIGGGLAGGNAEILANAEGYGGIAYTRGRATWSFDLRLADFDDLTVNVAGGGLRVALPGQSAAWVNYYRFATDYGFDSSDVVHSWVLGASGRTGRHLAVGAEYTRGPDQLFLLARDRTGAFEANTYSAFADFLLSPMLTAHARYDYQQRPLELQLHRATLSLVHRF